LGGASASCGCSVTRHVDGRQRAERHAQARGELRDNRLPAWELDVHVEPPEGALRTVKDFASHYAMIVLSIVTALALEQAAVSYEHAREGRRARQEIELEIQENKASVGHALSLTRANMSAWNAVLRAAAEAERSGQANPRQRMAAVGQAMQLFGDSLPPLKTTAWDAAIASHAVDYLPHEDLHRYSEIYAAQRVFTQAMWDMLRDGALRNIADLSLAKERGEVSGDKLLETLNWRARTLDVVTSDMSQLEDVLSGVKRSPGS
jgi:hypothetical protein